MVKSINEPLSTAEVSTNMPESNNEQSPVAVVAEDGSTVFGEVLPPAGEVAANVDTSAPDKTEQPPTPPLGLLSPVDESGLTEFINNAGKPN